MPDPLDPPRSIGIDIGGSGIKGAIVDLRTGMLISERVRIPTPAPATPEAVAATVKQLLGELATTHDLPQGPIGIDFPAVVRDGHTWSAANVDATWIGAPAERLFREASGREVVLINDADAAGVAEVAFGVGQGRNGTIMMLTLGTGVGSALFSGGELVPNTEFGHLELRGTTIENYVSDRIRKQEDLSWKAYGKRLAEVLRQLDAWFSVQLFIIGGGASKAAKWEKYAPYLVDLPEVRPAALRNAAGIVGAAYAAHHPHRGTTHVDHAPSDP